MAAKGTESACGFVSFVLGEPIAAPPKYPKQWPLSQDKESKDNYLVRTLDPGVHNSLTPTRALHPALGRPSPKSPKPLRGFGEAPPPSLGPLSGRLGRARAHAGAGGGLPGASLQRVGTQRAQYPLIEEYRGNHIRIQNVVQGMFIH